MPRIKHKYDTIDEVPEAYRDLYETKDGAAVLTGVIGVVTIEDRDALKEALRKEREDHKSVRSTLKSLTGDMEVDEVKERLAKAGELEDLLDGKLDEDALEEAAKKRAENLLARRLNPVKKELDELKSTLSEREKAIESLTREKQIRALEDTVRPLMAEAKIRPEHQEDVLLYARQHLVHDPDLGGFVVGDGAPVDAGLSPTDWLNSMVEKRPGWLPGSTGAGARGGSGGFGGGADNPFSAKGWNLTKQGQMVRSNPEQAQALAKAAGTTIGGPKPE